VAPAPFLPFSHFQPILDNQNNYNKLIIWLDHLFKSLYLILRSEMLSGYSPCIISRACTF